MLDKLCKKVGLLVMSVLVGILTMRIK